ncbi:MAG: hypothetical protein NTV51_04640 [Verrucomicrobia bacterium]|nr:hypothetical protein [Verrucomicrobiota bacterium]
MRRLSSTDTKFFKRVLPKVAYGLALVVAVVAAIWMLREGRFVGKLVFVPVGIAAVGLLIGGLFCDLVDEVWDDGDALVVRDAGVERRIPFSAIREVDHSSLQNPPTITLTLGEHTLFATSITFMVDTDQVRFFGPRSRVFDEIRSRIAREEKGRHA